MFVSRHRLDEYFLVDMTESSGEPAYTLDVREIEGQPFEDIQATLDTLEAGERFHLVADFEPAPLYSVLESRGFSYETDQRGEEWHVDIRPE